MKILLFGVSNVGKTTIGKLLAERIGFDFYDLDDEVKSHLEMTLEQFTGTADLRWRDQKRGSIIKKVLKLEEDVVFSITPISYPDNFKKRIINDDILLIELYETPENIFSRLVFSDENDNIYTDDLYKSRHKDHYLSEIQADLIWYGKIYHDIGIHNRLFIDNNPPLKVVDRIISEYGLSVKKAGS